MIVDLSQIVNIEGARINFAGSADLFCCEAIDFTEPVAVSGTVSNLGGDIDINVRASGKARFVCDRCLDEFEREISVDFTERLVKSDTARSGFAADGNAEAVEFSGNSIDIDGLLIDNFIMSLPIKSLCSEDCKGLCSSCGKNLNKGDCDCDTSPTDPRFDILDKFTE